MLPYLFLAAALFLSTYSQLTMKARALVHASASDAVAGNMQYLLAMGTDWRVIIAGFMTFLAGVFWLLAIQRLELGYAFPFMALSFVLVPAGANLLFGEPLPVIQLLGLGLICIGVTITALSR
jgi:multidrug transporter EmrE-like cation transporter